MHSLKGTIYTHAKVNRRECVDVAVSFVKYAPRIGITTDSSVAIAAVLHSRTLLLQNGLEEIFLAPKVSGLL